MEWIVLKEIKLIQTSKGTRVEYDYSVPQVFEKYVKKHPLFVEFFEEIENVPKSILAVPFVGIMSTVTMLLDIGIEVQELDENFYVSLKNVEKVFKHMYPKASMQLKVKSDKLRDCGYESCERNSLFFTGGVDATAALVELNELKPTLINIWGGDLRLTDDDSHVELQNYLDKLTAYLGLEYKFIKTNAREMFEENALGFLCEEKLGHKYNHGWWASIAHIMSMTTAISPWIWKNKIPVHYIGSSYDGKTKIFDSNNNELISALRYASCEFKIVDEFVGRNEKVDKIIAWRKQSKAPIELKVCWQRTAGRNCSSCEKCYRTIMNIIVNWDDPNEYGFVVDRKTLKRIKLFLENNTVSTAFWNPICLKFKEEKAYWCNIDDISWILDIKINSFFVYVKKIRRKIFSTTNG